MGEVVLEIIFFVLFLGGFALYLRSQNKKKEKAKAALKESGKQRRAYRREHGEEDRAKAKAFADSVDKMIEESGVKEVELDAEVRNTDVVLAPVVAVKKLYNETCPNCGSNKFGLLRVIVDTAMEEDVPEGEPACREYDAIQLYREATRPAPQPHEKYDAEREQRILEATRKQTKYERIQCVCLCKDCQHISQFYYYGTNCSFRKGRYYGQNGESTAEKQWGFWHATTYHMALDFKRYKELREKYKDYHNHGMNPLSNSKAERQWLYQYAKKNGYYCPLKESDL